MTNTLTQEQRMLQTGVERFVREHGRFEQWRLSTARSEPFDRAHWKHMADLGWLGLGLEERFGGIGGSATDTALILDGFGRGLLRGPYVSSCILSLRLLSEGGQPHQTPLLEGIAQGTTLVTAAVAEPHARFHLHLVNTSANPHGEGFALSGEKSWVPDASTADWIVIPARTSGQADDRYGISLFLVAANAPGMGFRHYRGPDHQQASQLRLHQVQMPASALLGPRDEGLALLERAVDHAIVARLAEACGAMDAVCEITLEYLKTRKQFGVTIGSFQALQHRMVDMMIACEESRAILGTALQSLGSTEAQRSRAVSAAKVRIGQCGLFVGHQAVQLHGGIGTSDELAVSHYLKRLLMIDMAYGNSDHHLERFANGASA